MALSIEIKYPAPVPPWVIEDEGTYRNRDDGTWEQENEIGRKTGTYSVSADMLTVVFTKPAFQASTAVWKRR